MRYFILVALSVLMFGCNGKHHRKHKQKGFATVQCYKVDNKKTPENGDFMYYYVIDGTTDGGSGSY